VKASEAVTDSIIRASVINALKAVSKAPAQSAGMSAFASVSPSKGTALDNKPRTPVSPLVQKVARMTVIGATGVNPTAEQVAASGGGVGGFLRARRRLQGNG
jgi:hypothetical protein